MRRRNLAVSAAGSWLTDWTAPAAVVGAVALVVHVAWDIPAAELFRGTVFGGLTALVALGIALVWRANRVINFAQGELGVVPVTIAFLLITSSLDWPWPVGFATGLAAAVLLGLVTETVIVRRFARSPRLVLTVATIGIGQVLTIASLQLPGWFEDFFGVTIGASPSIPPPFDFDLRVAGEHFGANYLLAIIAVPTACIALWIFLRFTAVGAAVRAVAERADRAALLGIPTRRIGTIVWVIATVLGFIAIFLRASIVGLGLGQVLGPAILLRALAAAVVGRMERFPTIVIAAIGLGIVERAVLWHWGSPFYVDPVLFLVILVALLATSGRTAARTGEDEVSTWRAVREVRPVPRELTRLTEVRLWRWTLVGLVTVAAVVPPLLLSDRDVNLAATILIFSIVALSLVVLTGWAGQVSLGQMAFVGIGGAVAASMTARLGWDLAVALLAAGLVGALVAVVIGLPALRRRGLTLAVLTLAFALVTSNYLLNPNFFGPGSELDWLPPRRVERGSILVGIDVSSERAYYYLCLVGLALALVLVRGLRRSRTGRALIAIRENERAAEAFGVHARRTTLWAFVFSGFLAAFAGALFVHHQNALSTGIGSPYSPGASIEAFSMTVIGGLGSPGGAVLGAAYVRGTDSYLPGQWQYLATGGGLLLVLLVLPGGLGAGQAEARDHLLRRFARRRGIAVPSLVAERPDVPSLPSTPPSAPEPREPDKKQAPA